MAVLGEGVLDRQREMGRIERALDACLEEQGTALFVRGLPGIGKTALLEAAARLAKDAGCAVARARGDELERQLGFAVVHQLLTSRPVRMHARALATDGAGRAAAALVDPYAGGSRPDELSVLHGLWSMFAEAAAAQPLVLIVDDLHWADEPSLRFLAFLAHRISGLPVLLVAASRPPAAAGPLQRLEESAAHVLELKPLSPESVRGLVEAAFADAPDDAFAEACLEISGGNPLYLEELLLAARAEDLRPLRSSVTALSELGPDRIAHSVLRRCREAGPNAVALAEAMAVLGPEIDLRHAAAVAGLELERAARAWDDLIAAHVLRAEQPPAFLHPVLRASVLEAMSRERRLAVHTRAADEFAAAGGAALERVALHLLTLLPRRRTSDALVLRGVAGSEAARGSPQSAMRLLRRALEEPLLEADRAAVELELARHEVNVGDDAARERLQRLAGSPRLSVRERSGAAALLIHYAMEHGVPDDMRRAHRLLASVDELDADTRLMHEAMTMVLAIFGLLSLPPDGLERAARLAAMGVDGSTPGRRAATLVRALMASMTGSAAEISHLCEQALAEGALLDDEPWGLVGATAAASWLGSFGRADACDRVASWFRAVARSTGSTWARDRDQETRAKIAHYRGDLVAVDALAGPLAERGVDQIAKHGLVGWWVRAAIERGDLAEAERRFSLTRETPGECIWTMNRAAAEAWLRLAQHRYAEALEVAPRAEMWTWIGWPMPAQTDDHFRWVTALARHALGDAAGARVAAAEAVTIARRLDEDRRVGIALRIEAEVSPREEALPLLEEAISRLERSEARLEHARALVDYGVLLRTGGHRAAAREPLRRGLDLAAHSGATTLGARAREELCLAGAKPRRDVITGRDALTPAENRVAQLAAQGLTSREIAQALFLSVRTVETHLLRIYGKLGISSRSGLPGALDATGSFDRAPQGEVRSAT